MRRITLVWLLLIAATSITAFIGESPEIWGGHAGIAAIAVLLIATIKVHFVIYEFMDVRIAPVALKLVGTGWSVLALISLTALYFMPTFNVLP